MYNLSMAITISYSPLYSPDISKFISAKKAAKRLGISSSRLRLLASQGRVKYAYFDPKKGWCFDNQEIIVSPGARGPEFGIKAKAKKTKPYLSTS